MKKETVYDEKIFPHMAEIIKVCHEHNISMIADFELDVEEGFPPDDPLMCLTAIIKPECASAPLRKAEKILQPVEPICFAETIETLPDGSKKITILKV